MNKKGFLLAEETLKIILAVIAIGFLAYLLYSIYQSSQNSKDLELAEESLNFLISEIDSGKATVELFNPNGWSVVSWPYNGDMPFTCSNLDWKSCVCICKNPFIKNSKNYAGKCDDTNEGICVESSFKTINEGVQQPIDIEPVLTLNIDQESKEISV